MKIVCLGDSITFGYGVPHGKSWPALAQAETGWTIVNAGICGDTTGGMLARLTQDALMEKPDVLMLLGGTNDLMAGCGAGAIQANVMAILQQAKHRGVRPMLGTLPPFLPEHMPAQWRPVYRLAAPESAYAAYQGWLPVFAEGFDAALVDFYAVLCNAPEEDARSLLADGVHPNAHGHRLMANCFLAAARRLV